MQKTKVGKIKNIAFAEETQELELTIIVTDPKFKKKLLRDLSLSGNLTVEDGKLVYVPTEEE
jgi:hypothetical protein